MKQVIDWGQHQIYEAEVSSESTGPLTGSSKVQIRSPARVAKFFASTCQPSSLQTLLADPRAHSFHSGKSLPIEWSRCKRESPLAIPGQGWDSTGDSETPPENCQSALGPLIPKRAREVDRAAACITPIRYKRKLRPGALRLVKDRAGLQLRSSTFKSSFYSFLGAVVSWWPK